METNLKRDSKFWQWHVYSDSNVYWTFLAGQDKKNYSLLHGRVNHQIQDNNDRKHTASTFLIVTSILKALKIPKKAI